MPKHRVVAMSAIPNLTERGLYKRSNLAYRTYGERSWRWWCRNNGVEFVVLDTPLGGAIFKDMSPVFQRWLAPKMLMEEFGRDTAVALVDADTMIRWDAPSVFDAAGGMFAAVRGGNRPWIISQIRRYQHLFPGVHLNWWEYFNAGLVTLGSDHLPVISTFLAFLVNHWAVVCAADSVYAPDDQTPLNFIVQREGVTIRLLPDPFNLLHCFPMTPTLEKIEQLAFDTPAGPTQPELGSFVAEAFSRPNSLDFVEQGYVWHFTNVVAMRCAAMEATWKRIRHHYPGADSDADCAHAAQDA